MDISAYIPGCKAEVTMNEEEEHEEADREPVRILEELVVSVSVLHVSLFF